jgi:hypothetical protein
LAAQRAFRRRCIQITSGNSTVRDRF